MLDAPPPPPPAALAAAPAQVLPRGTSAQGRPLRATCRGQAGAPRRLLVVAGTHGDEPGTLAVTRQLARRTPPAGVRVCVVHRLNPDGLARGTRTTARGVDLNRNFPHRWRTGPRGRFFPGPRAASEPETRWAMRVVRALRPTLTVWVHQPYGIVVRTPTAPDAVLRAYARRARLPVRALAPLRGTAVSWAGAAGLPGLVAELRGGPVPGAVAARHAAAALAALRATP